MARQLALMTDSEGISTLSDYDTERFRLDDRTRAIGLAGVARARAVLEAGRQARSQHATAA
jgi:hypothetical protein